MRAHVTTAGAVMAGLVVASGAFGQGVREHTRQAPNRSAAITESQATELTLTVTDVAVRPIQVWVRTAGATSADGRTVTAILTPAEGALVKVGQRVRAFPPEARASMFQARVSQVVPRGSQVQVVVTLVAPGREGSLRYVLEIVTERGEFLSVPNEAIIETGGTRVVYVQQAAGRYVAKEIQPGVQGELFTQVLDGLESGEQVVTTGSFFIDADHKLKGL